MCVFLCLFSKDIYHYWKYWCVFQWGRTQMEVGTAASCSPQIGRRASLSVLSSAFGSRVALQTPLPQVVLDGPSVGLFFAFSFFLLGGEVPPFKLSQVALQSLVLLFSCRIILSSCLSAQLFLLGMRLPRTETNVPMSENCGLPGRHQFARKKASAPNHRFGLVGS